jgi:hypothetical protein
MRGSAKERASCLFLIRIARRELSDLFPRLSMTDVTKIQKRYDAPMQLRTLGGKFTVRIAQGEELVKEVSQFLKEQDIKAGSITEIGAANHVKLRYYDMRRSTVVSEDTSNLRW